MREPQSAVFRIKEGKGESHHANKPHSARSKTPEGGLNVQWLHLNLSLAKDEGEKDRGRSKMDMGMRFCVNARETPTCQKKVGKWSIGLQNEFNVFWGGGERKNGS